VLALVGHGYTSAMKESENRVKYTELAISILKDKPTSETKDVRAWAIDVVNQYSGVSMSAQVKEQLLRSRLIASDMGYSDFTASKLAGSKFDGALLDGASFRGASFHRADLRGADLSDAIIDQTTRLPK
jgi:Pentapeptide repeats (8 copies)